MKSHSQLTESELATSPFDQERLCDRCDQPIVGPIFKDGIERIGRCCKAPREAAPPLVRPPLTPPPLRTDTPVALPTPAPAPLVEAPVPTQPEPVPPEAHVEQKADLPPIRIDPDALPGKCRILGCEKRTRTRGLCEKHYAYAHRTRILDQVGLPPLPGKERARLVSQAKMQKKAIRSLETPLRPALETEVSTLKSRPHLRLTRANLKHRLLCLEEADKIREGLAKNSPLTWDGYELPLVYFRPLLEQRAAELEAAALEVLHDPAARLEGLILDTPKNS